jgi:FkbM family methyltransferase
MFYGVILFMSLFLFSETKLLANGSHDFQNSAHLPDQSIITFSPQNINQLNIYNTKWSLKANGEAFLLKKYLKPGFIVFDVGANIGEWSIMAFQSEPNIHIFAFEPLPIAFNSYKKKLQTSLAKAELFQLALSDHLGRAEFYHCTARSTLSSLFRRDIFSSKKTEKISVELDTLDHFCTIHHINKIDYLKIDTEGGEISILQGAKNLLKNHYVTALQFEYGGCYKDAGTTLKEAMQILTEAGYVIFRIIPNGLMYIPAWDLSLENFQLCNYFAILQSEMPAYSLTSGL